MAAGPGETRGLEEEKGVSVDSSQIMCVYCVLGVSSCVVTEAAER